MNFVELNQTNGNKIWVNLDNVDTMLREEPEQQTRFTFTGLAEGNILVRETPEEILAKAKPQQTAFTGKAAEPGDTFVSPAVQWPVQDFPTSGGES